MREDSSSRPTFSLQTPNFLGLGVTNLELDRISGPCLDLGPMTEADKTSNSCSRRGIKRVSQETGAGLEVKSDGSPDSGTGENLGAKKIRVSETIYGKFPSVSSEVEGKEKGSVENGAVGFQELGSETEEDRVLKMEEEHVRELDKVGPLAGCVPSTPMGESIMAIDVEEGEEKWEFDLNVPFLEPDYGGSETGLQEYTQVGPVITDRRSEIIAISSDESEDECQELVGWRDDRGKEKENEKGLTYESIVGFDLDLGIKELDLATAGSSLTSGGRRFTREEKGKAKLVEPWLSLSADPRPLTLELFNSAVSGSIRIQETSKPVETRNREESEFRQERVIFREREDEYRNREILERRARARRFALSSPQREDCNQKPLEQEQPSAEADMDFVDLMSPFPTALRMIRERNLKQSAEQLIKWKPSQDHDRSILTPLVPSLLDLCLKVLAKNADAIVSLEPCPDALRQRLTDLLCDSRQMNVHALDLLLRGSPTEIRIKDCSWITEEQFTKEFGSFDTTNLRVLQLNLCGQCVLDDTLGKTLARSSNNLPGLGIISLRGACRLSDNGLKALVASAPALCSINLGQCSLLTNAGINILADSLGSILRELYIDDCNRIDAMLIAPALKKFEHLEVLSVAGIQSVCDGFVSDIITSCGRNIKELDLADCPKLTDISLKVVGKTCSDLRSLNISNLHKLTDLGIQYLAIGCKSLQTLKLCRNGFSDEAIAAFLEVSGGSLKELSLNNVVKVGPSTALSLAKYSRKLLSLDISWCRRITDEALGLIVDSCLSLKLLKLFGCTQVTNVFLNGNSNSLVRIIGLNMTPILEHVNMLEAKEVLLRYSPLPLSYDSQNMHHQDV